MPTMAPLRAFMITKSATRPTRALLVLTPDTGLVGFPKLTEKGVELKTLMLARIKPGRLVKVDPASVQTELGKTEEKTKKKAPPKPNANGIYIVDQIRYVGDNMSGEFNCYITTEIQK